MRLVQVAKALGMTGQQLRKELTQVDFGVKPTDREIPENLAQGVLRFLARKYNITIQMDALTGMAEEEKPQAEGSTPATEAAPMGVSKAVEPEAPKGELHVLRKLTLDDVPREAIAREAKKLTKEEQEERLKEAKVQARSSSTSRRRKEDVAPIAQEQIKKKDGVVVLPAQITVKEFSEKAGIQVPKVVAALLKNGVMATINQTIDYDTAAIVAAELGVQVAKEEVASVEHLLGGDWRAMLNDEPEHLQPRPPIVVVMGHVDHGKTSLLDAIRKSDVAAGESGGITQHIGAYQVEHAIAGTDQHRRITFLDTPGHEAFTAMRARGAQVTDVAILVVAADDGVRETTIEAINHAKEAKVPMMVAISKIDRPGADLDRVKGELAAQGLQPEEWGGSTPVVPYSAVTKQGVDAVLDNVLLLADLQELKANPDRRAIATVVESHLDPSHGPLCTVIVNTGTLAISDPFVCGAVSGKVRMLVNAAGQRQQRVPPSCPVQLSGFDAVPRVGDVLQVVGSDREARAIAEDLREQAGHHQKRSLSDLVTRLHEGKLSQLKVVLKTDAQGSLEAIQLSLEQQGTDQVTVKVIHGAVGAVTENDVMMAAASEGIVMAFRVSVPPSVQRTAEAEGVQVREYDVIYTLIEDVVGLLQGLLVPEEQEKILGHLEVKGVFLTKRSEQIIGGRVLDGVIKRVPFRVLRGEAIVGTGKILSLRRADNDIKEAKEDSECGMRIESSEPIVVGDRLEAYIREFKKSDAA